jgi:hypothetical protein
MARANTKWRLWMAGISSGLLLVYFFFLMPALYPPILLDWRHRTFVSLVCFAAFLSLFPVVLTPSPERSRALCFLVIPFLSIIYMLYVLLDWYYGKS